jgi:hypothetical protein
LAWRKLNLPGRLVVRTHAPGRRVLMVAALLLLAAAALFLAFELGRRKAGFDGIAAAQERAAFGTRISELENQLHEQRVQLSANESAQLALGRERSEVAVTIGDLQAQLARAQQDLEFYRGIANPQAAATQGALVRVQQFHVMVGNADTRTYLLRISLNRPIHPEGMVNGALAISIDGERGGVATTLPLSQLTATRLGELTYSFRYYANLEQAISLPADFHPARTAVEIRPARKGVAPYRQIFVWNPDSNP